MAFAAQALTVPKASLDVSLLRPDPASVGREDVAELHRLLYAVITECSPRNVQTCRTWLSHNIIRSQGRLNALGKYLVALSKSFESDHVDRQRIHLVFVIHDLLHHSKYHTDGDHAFVAATLHPHIQILLGAAYEGDRARSRKHFARLDDLLDLWAQQELFSAEDTQTLRHIASGTTPYTSTNRDGDAQQTTKPTTEPPYILPPSHGDRSTPYYDLPAGNLIPHIQPNSTAPLNPAFIRPIQFPSGPVDPALVDAVRNFLKEVDDETEPPEQGGKTLPPLIDALGQTLVRDPDTGELAPVDTYYGWSVEFCERMRNSNHDRDGDRSRGRSGSSTPRNRQRYSSSRSRTRRSESRSRDRHVQQRRRRSTTRSRSRSRSPPMRRQRSPSYSPPASYQSRAGLGQQDRHAPPQSEPPPPPPPPSHYQSAAAQYYNGPPLPFGVPHPPPPPTQAGQPWPGQYPPPHPSLLLGPNGMPIPPPPKPANYQGPWPPPPPGMPALFPPPPQPQQGQGFQNQWQGGPDPRRH